MLSLLYKTTYGVPSLMLLSNRIHMPLSPSKDFTLYVLGRSSAIVEMVTLADGSSLLDSRLTKTPLSVSPRLA
jgi:hypothetical protein